MAQLAGEFLQTQGLVGLKLNLLLGDRLDPLICS